jgi:outer membrane lipoprotein SlyB
MKRMKRVFLSALVGAGLTAGLSVPAEAQTYYQRNTYRYHENSRRRAVHRRHVRTAKRVGIGAAGGAAIGALAGGGKGAGIGAVAGAGAGALYDAHKRHEGQ